MEIHMVNHGPGKSPVLPNAAEKGLDVFVALHVVVRDRQALQQAKRDYLQEFEGCCISYSMPLCVRTSVRPLFQCCYIGVVMFLLMSSLFNPCPS